MLISIPKSFHPITRLTITYRGQTVQADFDLSHDKFDLPLPAEVDESEVGIVVDYLDAGLNTVDTVVLKEAVVKEEDEPVDEPVDPVIETLADAILGDTEVATEIDNALNRVESGVDEPVDQQIDFA